jgi:hypothetical protein
MTAKQNNPTISDKMNNSLVSESPATDSTTALLLRAPQPPQDGDFIRFPKLPGELRQEIWILALPGPRDILIRLDPQDMRALDVSDMKEDEHPYYRAKAYAGPVPAHLHVNQESRAIAKIYYELGFKGQTRGRPIYVDFKIDTICFFDKHATHAFYGRNLNRNWKNTEEDLEYMRSAEAKIQSLIIRGWDLFYHVMEIDSKFRRFTNLDRMSYVCRAQAVPHLQRWYQRRQMRGWKKVLEKLGASFREPLVEFLAESNFQTRFQHLL